MAALQDLTWPEVDALAETAVLAVPVGSTEQHGPHLPLSTDADIACALVGELAAAHREVVAGPLIPYGSSGEHAAFRGTLSIGQGATEELLVELGRSACMTFRRVLLVSTHGGNDGPLVRGVERLRREGRDVRHWRPGWGGDAHAGRTETSLMLAIAPKRVQLARAEVGAVAPLSQLLPRLMTEGVRAVSANGVLGDPSAATAAEGRRLLDDAVADLTRSVDAWAAT